MKSAENYVSVDIKVFRNSPRAIDFDIYLKLSDHNMAHVFSRKSGLDYQRLAQYISKGVTEVYIREDDLKLYRNFVARPIHAVFNDPHSSLEKKIAALLNMTEQNISELFTFVNITTETAEVSKQVISNYVQLLTSHPHSLALILKIVSHGNYLYYHSIAVAIFSLIIAKSAGQFDNKTLEIIGLGGLLHDVGFSQLNSEAVDCEFRFELNPEQKSEMEKHTKIGLSMISQTPNIPDEVRYIVYQHHEQPGGKGFPNQLENAAIYYPCKVVALADAFSILISKRPERNAMAPRKALELLAERKGEFDPYFIQLASNIFLGKGK